MHQALSFGEEGVSRPHFPSSICGGKTIAMMLFRRND